MSKQFNLQYRGNKAPGAAREKPSADTIRSMAARGMSRAQMAKELETTYAMLTRWIANSLTLNDAYNAGKEEFELRKHANAQK